MKFKRLISFVLASAVAVSSLSLSAFAGTVKQLKTVINVTSKHAKVVQDSTVYAGEVIVDGVSTIKYIWSEDMTKAETIAAAVKKPFSKMDDTGFAALMPNLVGDTGTKGLAQCSVADYAADMNSSWNSAKSVAAKYYPDKTVSSSSSVDLYEADEKFAAACAFEENAEIVDTAGQPYEVRSPLGKLSATNTDQVTYTVEDGVLVKRIDREIDYTCEAVKVIYTSVRVVTKSTPTIRTQSKTVKESVIYAGEILVDNESKMNWLYSPDITKSSVVFENLKSALNGTVFSDYVPTLSNDATGTGLAISSAHQDEMDEKWKSVSYVAGKYFGGTVGEETKGVLPAADGEPRTENGVDITGTLFNDNTFLTTLSVNSDIKYEMIEGVLTARNYITLNNEKTTIVYTKVNVSTAPAPTQKINTLNVDIAAPKAGTVVKAEGKKNEEWGFVYYEQNPKPTITLDSNPNYKLDFTAYNTAYPSEKPDGFDEMFTGTFEKGKQYYVEVSLVANDGYEFAGNDTMQLTVNGKKTDFEMSPYNADGSPYYMFYAKVTAAEGEAFTRLAGKGRYETAVEISKAGFETADTVVLAYGLNYADALAGVSLAKAKNAPILLTAQKSLPSETLAEIERLKAKNVVILGGTGAVGEEVEKQLKDKKLNVSRIAGKSRFDTAVFIAQALMTENGNKFPEDVFFVYAFDSADALSVSAAAAVKGSPVLYLKTNGELDDATSVYLASLKGKVKNAYVIGGTGVISDDMMKKAGNALGVTPKRLSGKNRYETCVAVNNTFKDTLNGDSICVATGMDFPDALAGGVFAANNKAPLFLVNGKAATLTLSDTQKSFIKTKSPQTIYVFGGTGAVPDSHARTVAAAV
ncbi:MAG: cell wall-binding repeat-containing protein [Ruminococcus sp.]|nr:cell wall-binding repeat-containing protein [Ruminococcus sp.]